MLRKILTARLLAFYISVTLTGFILGYSYSIITDNNHKISSAKITNQMVTPAATSITESNK